MKYHVHHVHSALAKQFAAEGRKDPVTGQFFKVGDKVVLCAECKSAFSESSWKYMEGKHCEQTKTLATVTMANVSAGSMTFVKPSPPPSSPPSPRKPLPAAFLMVLMFSLAALTPFAVFYFNSAETAGERVIPEMKPPVTISVVPSEQVLEAANYSGLKEYIQTNSGIDVLIIENYLDAELPNSLFSLPLQRLEVITPKKLNIGHFAPLLLQANKLQVLRLEGVNIDELSEHLRKLENPRRLPKLRLFEFDKGELTQETKNALKDFFPNAEIKRIEG